MQGLKKVLLIRFSSIGDIVLTTPVVRCIKEQTGAEIHFLTKKSYQSILDPNPHISKVWALNDNFKELIQQLKKEKYELIIDLHKNLRSLNFKRQLGIPSRSFDKINIQKWLMVKLKWNRLPDRHIVARYLDTTKDWTIEYDGKGLDYFIPQDQELDPAELAERYFSHQEILRAAVAEQQYVALVIGAAHATKRLPEEKIISIAKAIKHPVFLLGGPAEKEQGARIAQAAGQQVINTCGALQLHQSTSLVRQAAVVISHDTGMMHIAAAFNKDIISIWGNTIPAFGMYPFFAKGQGSNTIVQVNQLSCRPCSKIGYDQCPKGHFKCMQQIDESRIVGKVQEILGNHRA